MVGGLTLTGPKEVRHIALQWYSRLRFPGRLDVELSYGGGFQRFVWCRRRNLNPHTLARRSAESYSRVFCFQVHTQRRIMTVEIGYHLS